jgi:hypothetical protein
MKTGLRTIAKGILLVTAAFAFARLLGPKSLRRVHGPLRTEVPLQDQRDPRRGAAGGPVSLTNMRIVSAGARCVQLRHRRGGPWKEPKPLRELLAHPADVGLLERRAPP